jgi:hypothetical protein
MGDGGFFKGTTTDQDARWGNKEKRLIKSIKFPAEFSKRVQLSRVNIAVIKPWIMDQVTTLLGFEDEVVVEMVFGYLEQESVDPRLMTVNLKGFLEDKTLGFVKELWELLLSAQDNKNGIPDVFMERKKEELRMRRVAEDKARGEATSRWDQVRERSRDREERRDRRERGDIRDAREHQDRRDRRDRGDTREKDNTRDARHRRDTRNRSKSPKH